jgi:diguanylate cyclase (GGDEF)-like protein
MSTTPLTLSSGGNVAAKGRLAQALSSPLTLLAASMLLFAALSTALVFVFTPGGKAAIAFTDSATVVVAVAAAVLAGFAATRSASRIRLSWGLIAAGLAVWAASEALWSFYELILNQNVPFPSIADIGYLGAVPLLLAGVVLLGSGSRIVTGLRTTLDGIAIVLAGSVLVWHEILLPMYSDSTATGVEKVVGGAYPLGDLVLFFGLVLLLSRNRGGRAGAVLWLFSGGMAMMLTADIAFAYLSLSDSYVSGSTIDLGWIYGYLMIGYSAALAASSRTGVAISGARESRAPAAWRQLMPLALPVVMFAQLFIVGFDSPLTDDITSVVLSGLVLGAVFLRAAVVLTDNLRLTHRLLEARAELEKRVEQLKRANRKLKLLSATDDLTGLANHRALMEAFGESVTHSAELDQPLAIMLIDIDNFKLFNDTHGHAEGDRVLKQLARVMKKAFKKGDLFGRYGGDEFMAIMPGTGREEAVASADRLLEAAGSVGFQIGGGKTVPLAMSIGLAVCPDDSSQGEELLAYADASLYEAKQARGNNVVVAHAKSKDGLFEKRTALGVLEALVLAVDRKDSYTHAHSQRNAELAVKLGRAVGMSEAGLAALRIAGLLHDVGKIGIPDEILQKPGPLTIAEHAVMREHVSLSNLIIHGVPNLQDVSDAVYCHHERWDGKGYPRGLKGKEIPLPGRIMAVVDAYSAMTMDRPYRKALSHDDAIEELRRCSGAQFDPRLVTEFIGIVGVESQAA